MRIGKTEIIGLVSGKPVTPPPRFVSCVNYILSIIIYGKQMNTFLISYMINVSRIRSTCLVRVTSVCSQFVQDNIIQK